jgi:hypothetical protein
MTAPVSFGWGGCRVGPTPTGKTWLRRRYANGFHGFDPLFPRGASSRYLSSKYGTYELFWYALETNATPSRFRTSPKESISLQPGMSTALKYLRYTAQQAQPSAPQKEWRSETGNFFDHALA